MVAVASVSSRQKIEVHVLSLLVHLHDRGGEDAHGEECGA
jgi:hypothetical protein